MEDSAISPSLSTLAMSLIFKPLTFVLTSFYRLILTDTVWFIIFPLTVIVISIGMMESSFTLCLSIFECTREITSIRKISLTISLFLSVKPLSKMNDSFRLYRFLFSSKVRNKKELGDSMTGYWNFSWKMDSFLMSW